MSKQLTPEAQAALDGARKPRTPAEWVAHSGGGPAVPGYALPSDYYGPPIHIGNGVYRNRQADDPPPAPEVDRVQLLEDRIKRLEEQMRAVCPTVEMD